MTRALAPEEGDALVDGVSAVREPLEARRRMGVLPHNAGIYPHLSARENVEYFGALHGLGRKDRAARTVELLSLLEMLGNMSNHLDDVYDVQKL